MKKNLSIVLIFFILFSASSQNSDNLWTKTSTAAKSTKAKKTNEHTPKEFDLYNLNLKLLKNKLANTTKRKGGGTQKTIISFPNDKGELSNYEIIEVASMEPGLQNKFPDIKTYAGQEVNKKLATIRFSITKLGLKAIILQNEDGNIHIQPHTKDKLTYKVFNSNQLDMQPIDCGNTEEIDTSKILKKAKNLASKQKDSLGNIRIFRMALAVTGEVSEYILDQEEIDQSRSDQEKKEVILATIIEKINEVNAVFERDLALNFVLIENELDLIFLDPITDNFNGTYAPDIMEGLQTKFNNLIDINSYDIGHVYGIDFFSTDGVAALNSICSNNKALGVSNYYNIRTFMHEIGHQLGAVHTFNSCRDNGWESEEGVEQGCGKTIMSYGGKKAPLYFHLISIQKIKEHLATLECGELKTTTNHIPQIESLNDQTIPILTPFTLDANVIDIDGDELTYSWEQLDGEFDTDPTSNTTTVGPSFDWELPEIVLKRFMPSIWTVILGKTYNGKEMLPSVSRQMKFGLLVRDNVPGEAQTAFEETTITFSADAGPFKVTSQSSKETWIVNSTQTITWDVANTNKAPINCEKVNLLLSIDGGFTYPITLASNIENNGSNTIKVPDISTAAARIKVESVGNIFYNINKEYISINPPLETTFVPDDNFEQVLIDFGYDDVLDNYVLTNNINTIRYLDIREKNIESLIGIEDFKKLLTLFCSNNNLSSLDVSSNTNLIQLLCDFNSLSNLDVSSNTNLTTLRCYNNNLRSIDVGGNPNLIALRCGNNNLSSLDVSNNTNLTVLACSFNNLSSLDVSNNTNLKGLSCDFNNLSSLDVSNNINLTSLWCRVNNLSSLNVANNIELESFHLDSNNLTNIDLTNNIKLSSLNLSNNSLSSLDVSRNTNLIKLFCAANTISSLNVSNNTNLDYLSCGRNNLSSLDVSKNSKLTTLACDENSLSSLDVSNNTNLIKLFSYGNNISSLDLSKNSKLTYIACSHNKLKGLNLKNGNNNIISVLSTENNPELTCIQVDDITWSATRTMSLDSHTSLSESCSYYDTIDIDEDGVLYNDDLCHNTPTGEAVDENGCSKSQQAVLSVKDCEGDCVKFGSILVYPNPTKDILFINVPIHLNEVEVALYNNISQLISKSNYEVTNGKIQLSLKNLPTAIYNAIIFLDTPISVKIVKQ